MKAQRTLVLDIETSLMLVYTFDIKDQYITPDQIHTDWHILAWGAKWLGESKTIYYSAKGKKDDRSILKPLWKLLDAADLVLTQNGKNFDAKKINARFILNGYKPPSPYRHYDTYQLVHSVAKFTSHSLEYLTSKLCLKHKKQTHNKFPGKSLWIECYKQNNEAWKEMKIYNLKDVLSTEELALKIRAWAPSYFPKMFDMTNSSSQCGTCGYEGKMIEGKPRKAIKYYYKQNRCPKCGAFQTGMRIK